MLTSSLASALCDINITPQMAGIVLGISDVRIAELLRGDLPTVDESELLARFLGRSTTDLFPRLVAQA